MSSVDALSELAQKELAFRKEEWDSLRLQRTNLPFQKRVINFDFNFQPQINKSEILDLCSLRFMDTSDNLLFVGNSGVGKTHLAISIASKAMEKEKSCYFALSNELVDCLLKAHKCGTLENTLRKYTGYDVLIIDEVGYLPFSQDGANLLFQLINRHYETNQRLLLSIFLYHNGQLSLKIRN